MSAIPTNMTEWETMMVKNVAPAVGVFTSSGIGLGPLSAVLHCRKIGDLGELNPDPFPFLLGNAIGWIIYSAATENLWIFAANVTNVLLGFFFVLTGYGLTTSNYVRRKIEVLCLFFLSLWMGVGFFCAITTDDALRVNLLGVLCNILVIILFASPLSTLAKVVATRSSASLNRPFTAVQILNCSLWLVYGLATQDMYVWVPNATGLLLGIVQLFLILIFPRGKPPVTPDNDIEEPLVSDGHES